MNYYEPGYEVVKRAKALARSTFIKGVASEIGFFGGCFAIDKENILVSGADGVGTKLKIAFMMGKHDTVGIDLVAMNVDDVVACGAKPLFFLDYIGCQKIIPDVIGEILEGIAAGCRQAGCALIGGETAELSDMYIEGEYDLAGFAVGIVKKKKLIDGKKIKIGDKIIGIQSSGLHSNGYTLARKVLMTDAKLSLNEKLNGLEKSLGLELLTPTKIYTKSILSLIKKVDVKGIAHITGGGLPENVARLIKKGMKAEIQKSSWNPKAIFRIIQTYGRVSDGEMYKAFNMGVGMVVAVSGKEADKTIKVLNDLGEKAYLIGEFQKGNQQVEIV
ncbi:MAG: phosphoribosylformylglycinamidine cyclo-ligase [Candidatus Saganbacteria bacterium]|uniref:Phosphoribosylformylglycinamidine cyclo-ligase n=1 Tax=Candidatus Saganbacteria bacterium TaxID=2575572 RepID=A0A833L2X7_UNCSA|nr:MAG: phosphoribosylformylglycinamidine cyclo-ligase [Candidatus Saganbacteria bacterium]